MHVSICEPRGDKQEIDQGLVALEVLQDTNVIKLRELVYEGIEDQPKHIERRFIVIRLSFSIQSLDLNIIKTCT